MSKNGKNDFVQKGTKRAKTYHLYVLQVTNPPYFTDGLSQTPSKKIMNHTQTKLKIFK